MQSGCASAEFASSVPPEILFSNLTEIYFCELHGKPFYCRLGQIIHFINEHTHPLIPSSVSINCTTGFSRCFDFYPIHPRTHSVSSVYTSDD